MIAVGVANPSAHGQAMMSTETAASVAWAIRVSAGATTNQVMNVRRERASTTGTKIPETRSASF